MELRQLEAFAVLADELHFGRAAARLHLGQPTLSESIRRLERELGTPLFARTSRRVSLTSAGEELLARAKVILDEVAAAVAAVRRVADGDEGTVRVGITPPVAPVLAPHLQAAVGEALPRVELDVRRLWLPALTASILDGIVDVALTCGLVPDAPGVASAVFCAEPLLVGVRPGHRLSERASVSLGELAGCVLGVPDADLFPAWALAQQQALRAAGVEPPTVPLEATDLAASGWQDQQGVEWVLLVGSLGSAHRDTVVLPVEPAQRVPYTLQWVPERARSAAVGAVVRVALRGPVPDGWVTQPGHLRHDDR